MSTPRPSVPRPATARAAAPRIPPGDRGATRIADRVIAKIAAQAAREALGTDALPADPAAAPHATVTVHHDIARVRIGLELGYPSDIAARCAAVRRVVAERIEEYTAMAVPEVDIDVERLHPEQARAAGRGRVR
ncbi:Asp23/Gls24 family envelope stress response protein [Streptomyces sp. NPDC051211]|uniref:Asp23/Gls24 family envelope stress response protein n=1 Tax=Streptomyces sp. NPDC051211 TaxID=3154643 RepID=UPI0034508A10